MRSDKFGKLLKGAINSIATFEGKTAPIVEDELGRQVGISEDSIKRYKAGHIPPEIRTIQVLAEAAVKRGYFGRDWLLNFLQSAHYPSPDKLLEQLCPSGPTRSRPPRVYQNLPAPTYNQFVMRQQAYNDVADGLNQRSAVVLIVSLGGMGKTSLAREIATCSLQEDNDSNVPRFDAAVWISDKDRPGTTTLSIVLDEIARTLDYPGFTQFEYEEKRREVEQLLHCQRVLLVLDNCETVTDSELVRWLLRLPEPSKAIITTREYNREFRRSCWPVELRGMSEAEAQELINQRLRLLRMDKLITNQTQVTPLVTTTGGNPKAIEMALGYLKYQHLPFQQVIDDLYAARGEIFDDLFTRCWSLLDEAARRVLLSMPMFVDSISSEALSAVADVRGFAFDLAIERLTDLALLDVQQTDLKQAPRYTLHALVRAFALAKLSEQASFNAAARGRWMDWYIELASKADYCWNDANKLKILDPEKNNIIGILRWCYEHQKYGWIVQLMKKVKFYHYVRGLWGEYQDIYLLGIEATHKVGDFAEEILLLSYYIEVTSFQKKTNTTEMLERLHYLIKENSTNLELKYIYNYYQTLGIYWSERDELDKAYQYWQKALEVALQDRSHFMATAYQNVGVGLYRKKLIPEAQEMFQKAFCQALHFHYQKTMFCSQWRLANIALDKVELDKAKEFLTHSENYLQIYQDRRCIALLKQSWARFYSLTGNDTLANTLKDTANDLFKRLGIKPSEDTCLLEEPIEQWNQVDIKATEQLLKFDSCDFDEVEEG